MLFCPAWLNVSCVGSSSFPLNPRKTNMAATHARTHITHTLLDTNTYGLKDTPNHAHTYSVMHQLVAYNWIGTCWEIFLIWWPDVPQWRGICSLSVGCVRHGFRGYLHSPTVGFKHTHSFAKSLTQCPEALLLFCNTTLWQYSLNCLAVYFLKELKSST